MNIRRGSKRSVSKIGLLIVIAISMLLIAGGCMFVPQEEMKVSDFTNFKPLQYQVVRWTTHTVGDFLNEERTLGNILYMELQDKQGQPIFLSISRAESASIATRVWKQYADRDELGFWVYFNYFPSLYGSYHKGFDDYHTMAWFGAHWTFRIQAPDRETAQAIHNEIRSYVQSHRWKDFTPQAETI